MSRDYDPTDWYFALPDGRVYSTAQRAFVDSADGDATSAIDSVARIIEVLTRAGYPQLAPLNAWHVRAECQRRMIALVGARDARDLDVKIANASREAIRLQDIRLEGLVWTPEQADRVVELRLVDALIEQLRAASNDMEQDPPADYQDDARWR